MHESTVSKLRERLAKLYPGRSDECLQRILGVVDAYGSLAADKRATRWDERDVVLITYGDQVRSEGEPPLQTLRRFLCDEKLDQLINTVHILPFYPYSSDDGFSVIDYRAVDPQLGDWQDVRDLNRHVELMYDLVLNHCSQESRWFQGFKDGEEPYTRYFIEADPEQDLSAVTRPRSLPLLTPVETNRGTRHVWTTFSADQIDLNFSEPEVLAEMLDVLLFYVQQGARIIRLDAIAYLWKRVGTSCIHLPETHEVVKLMRDVLDAVAPHVILLTETNVPQKENISYFGDGDEAHMVYQFSLPPLMLDAFIHGDATPLCHWLSRFEPAKPGTTFFNFTASHDGVGVRPLEGLVSSGRFANLIQAVQARGGLVSTRRQADGSDSPYELNVAYVDALRDAGEMDAECHARCFLCSQAVMLSLPGVPGIYFHSLVGTRNDLDGVAGSGHPRRINRRRFQWSDLRHDLRDTNSVQSHIYSGYRNLLARRIQQPAFHPDGAFELLEDAPSGIVGFRRTAPDNSQTLHVLANVTGRPQACDYTSPDGAVRMRDLLTNQAADVSHEVVLEPYQVMWLESA